MKFKQYLDENFPEEWRTDWPESEVLSDAIHYALHSGGKRLRPLLCLKMCEALEGDMEQAQVFAEAIEAFHNYTLVHDDIQDGDTHRRGKESVWQRFGQPQGITIGDGLHSLSYHYLLSHREIFSDEKLLELLEIFNDTDMDVVDGQALDISFRNQEVTREEYMDMTRKKTGALLSASLKGAAVIAEAEEETIEHIERFGESIGPAFQIRDDIIDLTGNKGRESRGQDIREGKRSLVAVKALERLEGHERQELLAILNKEKRKTSRDEVERAIELFESVGAIEDANQVAENLIEEAKAELEAVEHDVSEIREITDFLVERKF